MIKCRKIHRRRLKYIATINDEVLNEDTDGDYELQYVDIGSVDSLGKIHEIATHRFADAPSRARRCVRDGDIIISCVRTYLQAIASVQNPPDNLIVSTGFSVIRPRPSVLNTAFGRYALRDPSFLAEVEMRSVGVNYPAINASELGNISIYLPSPPIQRAISNYLDRETTRLDALIAAKERVLELLTEKRRVLITRAVTRGLDPGTPFRDSGIPWLREIPAHWELMRAKFVFRQLAQPVHDEDEMVTCFRDGQVTLRRNRREEGFTNANLELGYQGIRAGQLVLHSMDAFAGAIGVSDSDGKCSPEYIICAPQDANVDSHYYGHLLRTMALAGYIQASCPAVRERAPRIRFSSFGEMFLPVPPKEEQQSIANRIGVDLVRFDALRSDIELTVDLLNERRAALIAKAVTGRFGIGTPS